MRRKNALGNDGGYPQTAICSFLAHSEKMNQKRGATPKAPYIGGCKQRIAETVDSLWVLVSRDTAWIF
jgi:hypothetical protein